MKILIIDDSQENLNAAKEAAKGFSDIDFEFELLASKAFKKLKSCDGVITDLIFPEEDDRSLLSEYRHYVRMTENSSVFSKVVTYYYKNDLSKAKGKLEDSLSVMRTGTIEGPLRSLIKIWESWRGMDMKKDIEKTKKQLKSLPSPQFPYGGAIMLYANKMKKSCVLITDLHRHARGYDSHTGAIDGMIILLPLIEKGIITVEEADYDGKNSLTYMGSEQGGGDKKNPETWKRAIEKILAQ